MKNLFKQITVFAILTILSLTTSIESFAQKNVEKVLFEGANRYETAVRISSYTYPVKSGNVILVNSEKISDSLSVGLLAKRLNCPILLTDYDELNASTLKEIKRLKSSNIILIGGKKSISNSQERLLCSKGYNTKRISGKDRIETSFQIATEVSKLNKGKNFDKAFVVHSRKSIVDAATISSVSCKLNSPILFIDENIKSFNEKYAKFNFKKIFLIGGHTSKFKSNFKNASLIFGNNRNDTSFKIADQFYKNSSSIFIAKNGEKNSSELIDCVTVAPTAAMENSPIIFVSKNSPLSKNEKILFDKFDIHKITLVGGGLREKFSEIVEQNTLKKDYVLLKVAQINQNKAGLPMGCEAASLLQCLHYKNIKKDTNVKQFIKEMPLASDGNPNHGFAGSPFNIDEKIYQSIFPEPLTKWANRYTKAENISGQSSEQIRQEIAKGNPVIFFGTYKFRKPTFKDYFWGKNALYNAHVMVVDGYDRNRMHIIDPAEDKPNGYWVSRSIFDSRYNIKKYAVVVR
ncbi:cell wall-binding repeat-containing protein [uncultured Finegoldia sp.]|uniref:cell wall-binding repeat-containing protein n=1 Tax=uncultured Finegoldia sp. TaxID=328009 RepID=UPI00262057A8|nr:cell wall-binding repeat-containing protein [uncultured Finegoldia sp.]